MSDNNFLREKEHILNVENDYYHDIKELVNKTKIYDFESYVNFSKLCSDIYFETCYKLFEILQSLKNELVFSFENYTEKRDILKKHNDSILDEIYHKNIHLFS